MEIIDKIMEHYNEALDELMDAQKYQKLAMHAEQSDDMGMYKNLAKQELEHEGMIEKSAERLLSGIGTGDMLHKVWHHLKKHLHNWKRDIEHKLEG